MDDVDKLLFAIKHITEITQQFWLVQVQIVIVLHLINI